MGEIKGQRSKVKGQRSGVRDQGSGVRGQGRAKLSTIHYPLSTIHYPRGVSLLEVLISIFILSIGLLGVASLIPIGKIALSETNKSDRTGACGRAGLRDVKIRRMLDYKNWCSPEPATPDLKYDVGSVAIDPWGNNIGSGNLGGANGIGRCSLVGATAEDFRWKDDLVFDNSDKTSVPKLVSAGAYEGNCSWFVTVTPAWSELNIPLSRKRFFNVSVVVCYKRLKLADGGEKSFAVTFPGTGIAYTGGSVTLTTPTWDTSTTYKPGDTVIYNGLTYVSITNSDNKNTIPLSSPLSWTPSQFNVKVNDWVMLCGKKVLITGQSPVSFCQWYRVVTAGSSPTTSLTLLGPDWDTSITTPTLVAVEGVSGVYSTVTQLDQ